VGWHSFRHTHGTLLTEVGESIKTTQAILGHSDLEATLYVYSHPIPESQRRAIERVAEILDPNGLKFVNLQQSNLLTNCICSSYGRNGAESGS
jgi:Phage integrase family